MELSVQLAGLSVQLAERAGREKEESVTPASTTVTNVTPLAEAFIEFILLGYNDHILKIGSKKVKKESVTPASTTVTNVILLFFLFMINLTLCTMLISQRCL